MSREEVFEKIKTYLDKMGVKFIHNKEDDVIVTPFKIGDKLYAVIIAVMGDWVLTVARVAGVDEIPPDASREELFARLLKDTFYLNEVTYGLTDNGDIVVHAGSSIEALDYENFKTEFYSVVAGIHHYVEEIEPEFLAR